MPPEWRGTRFTEPAISDSRQVHFPNDKLSIQVHPDDAYASLREKDAGGRGKTEMWHAGSGRQWSHVLVGTKPGVSKQMLLDAIAK